MTSYLRPLISCGVTGTGQSLSCPTLPRYLFDPTSSARRLPSRASVENLRRRQQLLFSPARWRGPKCLSASLKQKHGRTFDHK